MKKIIWIILLSFFVLLLTVRLVFSYTLITLPNTTGKVFEGGYKYKFPICIVNPFKKNIIIKSIKQTTLYNINNQQNAFFNANNYHIESIYVDKKKQEIISLIIINKDNRNSFIVYIDSETKELKQIDW